MQNAEWKPDAFLRPVSSFSIPPFTFQAMNPLQYILVVAVRIYRVTLSPAKTFLFGPAAECRFEPSCSQYAIEALKIHGAFAGGWLAAKRVCRCHPWGDCGHDPVPPKKFPVSNSEFQVSEI